MNTPTNQESNTPNKSNNDFDATSFTHSMEGRVRMNDVDRQNSVHNSHYFAWLENARVEYMRHIGLPIESKTFVTKHNFVLDHVDMDFRGQANFDDEYIIHTKVSTLRDSMFIMEQAITLANGTLLVYATLTEQHINPATKTHQNLPTSFRNLVIHAEGDKLLVE